MNQNNYKKIEQITNQKIEIEQITDAYGKKEYKIYKSLNGNKIPKTSHCLIGIEGNNNLVEKLSAVPNIVEIYSGYLDYSVGGDISTGRKAIPNATVKDNDLQINRFLLYSIYDGAKINSRKDYVPISYNKQSGPC